MQIMLFIVICVTAVFSFIISRMLTSRNVNIPSSFNLVYMFIFSLSLFLLFFFISSHSFMYPWVLSLIYLFRCNIWFLCMSTQFWSICSTHICLISSLAWMFIVLYVFLAKSWKYSCSFRIYHRFRQHNSCINWINLYCFCYFTACFGHLDHHQVNPFTFTPNVFLLFPPPILANVYILGECHMRCSQY
jgi:hypothetical protein